MQVGSYAFSPRSFLECVLEKSQILESILTNQYQASGKGLGEKFKSVEYRFDERTIKSFRFVNTIRNKVTHELGYVFDGNENDFLDTCDQLIATLRSGAQARHTSSVPSPKPEQTDEPKLKAPTPTPTSAQSRPSSSRTSASSKAQSSSTFNARTRPSYRPVPFVGIVRGLLKLTFGILLVVVCIFFVGKVGSLVSQGFGWLTSPRHESTGNFTVANSATRHRNSNPVTTDCDRIIKRLKTKKNVAIPAECQEAYNAFLESKRSAPPVQSNPNPQTPQSIPQEMPTTNKWEERDRQQREEFQRYNSPEARRQREEAAKREEEAKANDPRLKQEAIERERKRQQDLQKTYDRLMKKPAANN